MPEYNTIQGGWYATDLITFRESYENMHWSKIIVMGYNCDPSDSSVYMNYSYSWPGTWEPELVGETWEFSAPTYNLCGDPIDQEDINLQF